MKVNAGNVPDSEQRNVPKKNKQKFQLHLKAWNWFKKKLLSKQPKVSKKHTC